MIITSGSGGEVVVKFRENMLGITHSMFPDEDYTNCGQAVYPQDTWIDEPQHATTFCKICATVVIGVQTYRRKE